MRFVSTCAARSCSNRARSASAALRLHHLAAPEAIHHLHVFRSTVLGNDERDGLADRVARRPSEHPLGRGIPRGDGAVQVLTDDRVLGGLDDGREVCPRIELRLAVCVTHQRTPQRLEVRPIVAASRGTGFHVLVARVRASSMQGLAGMAPRRVPWEWQRPRLGTVGLAHHACAFPLTPRSRRSFNLPQPTVQRVAATIDSQWSRVNPPVPSVKTPKRVTVGSAARQQRARRDGIPGIYDRDQISPNLISAGLVPTLEDAFGAIA